MSLSEIVINSHYTNNPAMGTEGPNTHRFPAYGASGIGEEKSSG
jgi:hypothetical protein